MVYPHSFRHLFAKEYMQKIGDISELADLLGHTRLETTWIYTKTTSEEKRVRLEHLDFHKNCTWRTIGSTIKFSNGCIYLKEVMTQEKKF